MEYFRIVDKQTCETAIQEKVTPAALEKFTESMFQLGGNSSEFNGATLWGEFQISYHKINGGIRFTLLDCPNALAWTITTGFPPERTKIVVHATINRTQKPAAFIEEIQEFLNEWESGLKRNFK